MSAPAASSILKLMTWLSPAMPVGAFSYSHGLERAVHDGQVTDAASLQAWLAELLRHGSQWNDAVLAAQAWRCATAGHDLTALAELGEAMAGSSERHMETMLQGGAFGEAVKPWLNDDLLPVACPYSVAVGASAGALGIGLEDTLAAYLNAFVVNQTQVAIRLSVIGQRDAVGLIAALEDAIARVARRAAGSSLDDLGTCTIAAELAAIRHEDQHTRLFRT